MILPKRYTRKLTEKEITTFKPLQFHLPLPIHSGLEGGILPPYGALTLPRTDRRLAETSSDLNLEFCEIAIAGRSLPVSG